MHGPPGTGTHGFSGYYIQVPVVTSDEIASIGKTLTAEAVAELLQRPLYMVGSSELPASPGMLERSLRTILSVSFPL